MKKPSILVISEFLTQSSTYFHVIFRYFFYQLLGLAKKETAVLALVITVVIQIDLTVIKSLVTKWNRGIQIVGLKPETIQL